MKYPLIQPTTEFDAVILAGGDYPQHPLPLSILSQARHLVCCDSAFQLLNASLVHQVEAIVGDGDSLSDELKKRYQSILYLEEEQEHNDLTKATRYCQSKGYHRIAYLGTTGKREDYTLGNISLMIEYLRRERISPVLITDYGTFVPCFGDNVFESFARQQVSIFNFGCTILENENLRWPSYAYETWWQGTLNEALATRFSFHADGYYLVYRTHEAK